MKLERIIVIGMNRLSVIILKTLIYNIHSVLETAWKELQSGKPVPGVVWGAKRTL